MIEAVVLPTDPFGRSAVICDLINELCDAGRVREPANRLPYDGP
jgi:hypothetical protein